MKYLSDDVKLISEWDWKKNDEIGLDPKKISLGNCKLKPWWRCSVCGYEWQTRVYNRAKGVGCPKCAHQKRWKERHDTLLKEKGSIEESLR